jgi:tRNA threonylcarbamoyl adenosine modification protein YeaZ
MKILAIEFASEQRSVAVLVDGEPRGEASESGGRKTRAFALIERALQQAGLEREAIECLAVGLGPGSYTGIRAAISVAQGWQLAQGVRLLGLSTVECLAAQAQATGIEGTIHVVIDAQRDEFYLAGYEITPNARCQLDVLHLASLAEVRKKEASDTLLIWPELKRIFPQGRVVTPNAATLGRLAVIRHDFVAGERLEPIYLRETAFVKAPPPRLISNLQM